MGAENHTVQNLRVMKVDRENGIVVVQGAVPGPRNSIVKIQDAIKKPWPEVEADMGISKWVRSGESPAPPPVEA